MLGSEHNDEFYMDNGEVRTRTNRCVHCMAAPVHCPCGCCC
jgi:hypothetical protein